MLVFFCERNLVFNQLYSTKLLQVITLNVSIVEGQEHLADGLTAFNKVASEKFQNLDATAKERYANIAAEMQR